MTEPTDEEIIALADETRTAEGGANGYVLPINFARAVLAKWGTPPAVTVEPYAYAVYFPDQPTEELVHDLDELCDDLTNREHTITKLYAQQPTQAQAAPQSGAKSFQTYAEANAYSRGYYAGKKAATQARVGAVPLTDAQIDQAIAELGLNYLADAHATNRAVLQKLCRHAHGIKGGQHG